MHEEEEEDVMIFTPKLQLVLATKPRKLQYTSSPVISHHVSLSLLSSPDDLHTRASVPFSWEEEPGKPKHDLLLLLPPYSKSLDLPPRLLLPSEFTKMPLAGNHHHPLLAVFKRLFRWRKKKERADDDIFVFPSESGSDTKITRRGRLHCLCDVTRCYFGEVPWKNKKLKDDAF